MKKVEYCLHTFITKKLYRKVCFLRYDFNNIHALHILNRILRKVFGGDTKTK